MKNAASNCGCDCLVHSVADYSLEAKKADKAFHVGYCKSLQGALKGMELR